MKSNFVLVDFENVQPDNVGVLNGRSFKIKVFVGASQARIPFELARSLHAFGPDAEYVQIDGNGKNALDFHITYYLGRLVAENPDASFYVISKDAGFDPLIEHLRAQGISCQRSKSIPDIFESKLSSSEPVAANVDAIIANLVRRKTAKPKTLKTLRGTINALFKNKLADAELDGLIEKLEKRGVIKIADGKVQYRIGQIASE
jgi:PIN domain-containing protein